MLPGYHVERHDRSHKNSNKQTGGGVCAFIRNNLSYARLHPLGSDQFEILWLVFFVSPRVLLCVLYFPPEACNAEAVTEHIISLVENSMQNTAYGCVVVCGDLNSLDTGHISTHCNLHLCNSRLLRSHMRLKKNRPYNRRLKSQGHYLLNKFLLKSKFQTFSQLCASSRFLQ